MRIAVLATFLLLMISLNASAHYHMLIPDKHSVKTGEEVTLTYQFGHPFEHQLFDTFLPASASLFPPDGRIIDVKSRLKRISVPVEGSKMVAAFQLSFKPEQRGDHILVFSSPVVVIEGEKNPVFDTVKVVVHVQTQQGWCAQNAVTQNQLVDLIPLTRPYGLRAGMLFRATFRDTVKKKTEAPIPIALAEVEIERYNSAPPKELPPEEHITYTARTDETGVVAATLPEPEWWAVTALKPTPNGVHRCTFWVHVDGKIPLKPAD